MVRGGAEGHIAGVKVAARLACGYACELVPAQLHSLFMSSAHQQERPRRGGRPSKGNRVGLMVRGPRNSPCSSARDAATAGMSQSDKMTRKPGGPLRASQSGMTRGDGNAGSGPPFEPCGEDRDPT